MNIFDKHLFFLKKKMKLYTALSLFFLVISNIFFYKTDLAIFQYTHIKYNL